MSNGVGDALLEVEDLEVYFPVTAGLIFQRRVADVKAVDGVTFNVKRGETLGLVGESGCGKSTTGKAILQLNRPTAGTVNFAGTDLTAVRGRSLRTYRRRMQMIFQDPYASLNPRMSVGSIVSEPITIHNLARGQEKRDRVHSLLQTVGLNPYFASRYPHEFSGGQRQRIGIARALVLEPEFVVCDEPISALDVSVQAQVVNLLDELKDSLGLTLLFIAHDLSMVRYVSDRMAVMYLGSLVEIGPANRVFFAPKHPYTELLIGSNPEPDPASERTRESTAIKGEIPSPVNVPPGCRFANRCPKVMDICRETTPELIPVTDVGQPDRLVACHLYEANAAAA